MATIKNLGGKKPYRVDYTNGFGQRKRIRFKTHKEANQFLKTVEAEKLRQKEPLVPDWLLGDFTMGDPTVGEVYREYLDNKIELKDKGSARQSDERNLAPTLREFADLKVSRLGPQHILDFQKRFLKKGRAKTTCTEYVRRLKTMLNWAVDNGMIPKNPIAKVKVENGTSKPKEELSQREVDLFAWKLKEADPEIHDLFLFGINTGMRIGEMYSLEWDQVDLKEHRQAYLPPEKTKTSEARYVPLNDTSLRILKNRRISSGGDPWIFWHPAGADRISKRVRALSRRFLGKPHTPHYWRVTFATKALRGREISGADGKTYFATVDVKTVAEIGGWKPESKTLVNIYQKVSEEQKRSCVDLIDTGSTLFDTGKEFNPEISAISTA